MKCSCDECGRSGGYALYCLRCAELALKKEWVGLTDEEKQDAYLKIDAWNNCVNWIETTLREKNK